MTVQEQIRANRWRTVWLLLLFAVLVGLLGVALAYVFEPSLLIVVAIAGFLYAIFSWFASGSMVGTWTGAQKVEKRYPQVYRILENVSIAAGLAQTPELRVIQDPAPNAFAAGRNPKTAYVAVTTGLIQLMDDRELEGVLAHEVSHIRNRDVRLMTLVAVLVGVIALLSDVLLRIAFFGGSKRGSNPILTIIAFASLLIAPIAGVVIQLAVSRRREFLADASAAEITNDAEGMALALRKLLDDKSEIRNASRATAHMYIESPLNQASGLRGTHFSGLFSTHPPLEERIARLEEAGGFHLAA